ncbi:uncharacterized protein LOC135928618 [Gordionus sp. m RMFG-2023]|uniref:uncharacterized protein LOC135928618 n=1 Tax=Gordionus sp. m RMFG-2023 TaxID=3053472 RepID=UPI0031FCD8C9
MTGLSQSFTIDALTTNLISKCLSKTIAFLKDHELLDNHTCCNNKMIMERNAASYRVRCKICTSSNSIWKGSIFENVNIPVNKFIHLIYLFVSLTSISDSLPLIELAQCTIGKWYAIFRKIYCHTQAINFDKIGGPGHVIEIDESHIFKRKNNTGRILKSNAIWVVGGISRNDGNFFISHTEKRDKDTLLGIISKHVHTDSTIMTDKWKGYNNLNDNGYDHYSVNHSQNFVDPNDISTHTQRIERLWRDLKNLIENFKKKS